MEFLWSRISTMLEYVWWTCMVHGLECWAFLEALFGKLLESRLVVGILARKVEFEFLAAGCMAVAYYESDDSSGNSIFSNAPSNGIR
jgi:hypothetical protein